MSASFDLNGREAPFAPSGAAPPVLIPSRAASAARSIEGGSAGGSAPLLDRGTQLVVIPGQGGRAKADLSRYEAVVFPTCGEAVVWFSGGSRGAEEVPWPPDPMRADRRRRGAVRRYCVHSGLGYLLTLTFRLEPATPAGVWLEAKRFVRRLQKRLGATVPYVFVVERGETNGRLHLHVCVGDWYRELGVVVRCERCVAPGWVWHSPPPGRDRLCLGCLWGRGFVHGPDEELGGDVRANGDPKKAAMYVSKYVSKELRSDLEKGRQLYRVAEGFQPPEQRFASPSVALLDRITAKFGPGAKVLALHDEVKAYQGPPCWVVTQ